MTAQEFEAAGLLDGLEATRAGSVLATHEVPDAAGERSSWSRAGRRELKGFRERVPLYRARLAEGQRPLVPAR